MVFSFFFRLAGAKIVDTNSQGFIISVCSLEPKPSLEPKVMQETSPEGNRTWPSAGYIVTVTFRKPSPSAFTQYQTMDESKSQEHRAKTACW